MAPKAKKQPTPGYCRWCCSTCCTGFSIWCIFFGFSWGANLDKTVQSGMYKKGIYDKAHANYTDEVFSNRKHVALSVNLKFTFFNVTNPYEVQNGAAPKLKKRGPYVFEQYTNEMNVQHFNDYKYRASRKMVELHFLPGQSCPNCHLNDVIYAANKAYTATFLKKCQGTVLNNGKPYVFCKPPFIAKYGIFEPYRIQELIYVFREWEHERKGKEIVDRMGKTNYCPAHLWVCQQPWAKANYDAEKGANGGQFSANPNSKKTREKVKLTGYEDAACEWPFENNGEPGFDSVGNAVDGTAASGSRECSKGIQVGFRRTNQKHWKFQNPSTSPPLVKTSTQAADAGTDYNVFKASCTKEGGVPFLTQRDGAKTGIPTIMDKDGKCHSSYTDWLKYTTWNMYKWYDETPYDTTDDKAYDAGFLKDGSVGVNGKKEDDQPCKWDGSTNKIKGCPKMVRWYGKSFLIRGLFDDCLMQGTKCEHTLKYFDGATRRPLEWEWKKKAVKKGIKTFMYQIPEKHFKGSHENAKYGMPASGASFVDFPGDGAWPMQRVTAAHMGGVPIVLTRPHWLGGGAKAKQWNEEMGLRQPLNSLDNFEIYFEPTTGFPIDAKIQWQFNTMFRPANLKLHTGDANSPTVFDYSNLTLHNGETINLATLGKYRGCPDAETKGCPIMIPNYILSLELNWSANLAEKIKKIAAIMKKLGTFKFLMKFWAWGGMMGIFCVISCLSYHFFMSDNRKK